MLGMGDGTFDPDSAVTREQMVTIFFRYAKFCGVKTEAGTLDAFRDAASVSDYAREAMGWAVKAGSSRATDRISCRRQRQAAHRLPLSCIASRLSWRNKRGISRKHMI